MHQPWQGVAGGLLIGLDEASLRLSQAVFSPRQSKSSLDSGLGLLGLPLPEVSISAATVLTQTAFSRMHVCSGAANYSVTLPAAIGNAGRLIGIRMAAGLTGFVTVTASGAELIDGVATRIMWSKESAILLSDGTGWTKVAGRAVPMSAVMRRAAAQSIPPSTWTQIATTTTVRDNTSALVSPCADVANGRFAVRRPGLYSAQGFSSLTGLAVGTEANGGVARNTASPGDNPNAFNTCSTPASGNVQSNGAAVFECVVGDWIGAIVFNGDVVAVNTRAVATVFPTLSVTEIPNW